MATEADVLELGKGTTRLALLALLSRGEDYGYALLRRLREVGSPALPQTEGAVYPLLKRMQAEGLVSAAWRNVEDGVPARKYLHLTPDGRAALARLRKAWQAHQAALDPILEEA